jgi:hypothetical protein
MNYIFLILSLLFTFSCASRLTPEKESAIINAGLPKIDPELLEIQIQAEKLHKVFVSRDLSEKLFRQFLYEIPLIHSAGLPLLYKYTILNNDKSDFILWSKAIAKHRFNTTNGDERLELARELIEASIAKGDFKRTKNLLDCKKGQIISKALANDSINYGFYSTIPTDEAMWGGGAESRKNANQKIHGFYQTLNELAKAKSLSRYRGILLATTKESRKIQSCEIIKHL